MLLMLQARLMRWVTILTMGLIAGAGVRCDYPDGGVNIYLPRFGGYYYDDYYYEEVYYEEVYYDGWWWW